MANDIRNKKAPELCQIMISEMRHLCAEVKALKEQRWRILFWLIPTLLIVVNMFLDHVPKGG